MVEGRVVGGFTVGFSDAHVIREVQQANSLISERPLGAVGKWHKLLIS